jgi:hypothetical protein
MKLVLWTFFIYINLLIIVVMPFWFTLLMVIVEPIAFLLAAGAFFIFQGLCQLIAQQVCKGIVRMLVALRKR